MKRNRSPISRELAQTLAETLVGLKYGKLLPMERLILSGDASGDWYADFRYTVSTDPPHHESIHVRVNKEGIASFIPSL